MIGREDSSHTTYTGNHVIVNNFQERHVTEETTQQKYQRLREIFKAMGSVAIAYSGGVDSGLLCAVAYEVLGDKMCAYTISSPVESIGDKEAAQAFAAHVGFKHVVINRDDFKNPQFVANSPERCYHCKLDRLGDLKRLAAEEGYAVVVEGTNMDDLSVYRPGRRAVEELSVRSPLVEAGLTKKEIRNLLQELDLPGWDRPSAPCLATRFPYGTPITQEAIERIGEAETYLRMRGYEKVRVRFYDRMVRIEVDPEDIARLVDERKLILSHFKSIGFLYVTVDLAGYRSGSMDEVLYP